MAATPHRVTAAALYRSLGWSIIPARATDKSALVAWKPFQNRCATEFEVAEWQSKFPSEGIAVITGPVSGILVLDADGKRGVAEVKRRGVPKGPMTTTPSGGLHCYYRSPTCVPLCKSTSHVGESQSIDVRWPAAYVLAPYSRRPDGKRYEWVHRPDEVELPEAPKWFLRILEKLPAYESEPTTGIRTRPAVKAKPKPGTHEARAQEILKRTSERIRDMANEWLPKGQRSERDFTVVLGLITSGATTEEIYAVFDALPCGDKYRTSGGEAYLSRAINAAWKNFRVVQVRFADLNTYDNAYTSGVPGQRLHLALYDEGGRLIRAGLTVPSSGLYAERWNCLLRAAGIDERIDAAEASRLLVGRKLMVEVGPSTRTNPVVAFHRAPAE